MNNPRISIVVPCWGRPARTRRIINNILSQSINNWEAFIIGDGCPQFQTMIESHEVEYFKNAAQEKGNVLHCFNLDKNYGGYGYFIANYAIKHALGNYFIFAGNDDIILPNHFEYYLSEIENTDLDLVYYPTFIGPSRTIRFPELSAGKIGHSEVIFKTEFIKNILHSSEYGHDWKFIQEIIDKNPKHKKSESDYTSYIVTHIHHFGQDYSIDNID